MPITRESPNDVLAAFARNGMYPQSVSLPLSDQLLEERLPKFVLMKPKLVTFAYDPPGTWTIPVKLESEANMGGKMRGKMTRNKTVKEAIYRALGPYWKVWGPVGDRIRLYDKLGMSSKPKRPWVIVTRLGGRGLDTVNLWSSVKFVEDAIANLMGCNDGTPAWKRAFDVRQEPGERYGVRVEIQ